MLPSSPALTTGPAAVVDLSAELSFELFRLDAERKQFFVV